MASRSMVRTVRSARARARSELIRAVLSRRVDAGRALVVAGSPRSGTTWIAGLLGASPGAVPLFEPLHPDHVPAAAALGGGWRPAPAPDESWPEGVRFFEDAFAGRIVNWWTSREVALRRLPSADRLVVKFVRANRVLPWMVRALDLVPPVLVLRHPWSVVRSQLDLGRWAEPGKPSVPGWLPGGAALARRIEELETPEELLAASWAVDQRCALAAGDGALQIVRYEDVVADPRAALTPIFRTWNAPVPDSLERVSASPSRTTNRATTGGAPASASHDRVLEVVHSMGVTAYE